MAPCGRQGTSGAGEVGPRPDLRPRSRSQAPRRTHQARHRGVAAHGRQDHLQLQSNRIAREPLVHAHEALALMPDFGASQNGFEEPAEEPKKLELELVGIKVIAQPGHLF